MAARWGGEEFIALFPGACQRRAGALCEALLVRLRQPDADSVRVTVSIGIASAMGRNARQVIAAADAAMYAAKQAGRDQVVVASPMNESTAVVKRSCSKESGGSTSSGVPGASLNHSRNVYTPPEEPMAM